MYIHYHSVDKKKWKLIVGGVVGLGILCGMALYLFLLLRNKPLELDADMARTLEHVANIRTYTEKVDTETYVSDRRLLVAGTYYINAPENNFASFSTTTLIIPEGQKDAGAYEFTLDNISIADDIYTKVDTESEFLKKTIPRGGWQHFKKNSIPASFANIAVSGPVLDNLLLFGENGAYITLTEEHGKENWDEETLEHYTFSLSGASPSSAGGTLPALLDRIGTTGVIDVWIDADKAEIRHMRFENPPYYSTTTISSLGTTTPIAAPISTSTPVTQR